MNKLFSLLTLRTLLISLSLVFMLSACGNGSKEDESPQSAGVQTTSSSSDDSIVVVPTSELIEVSPASLDANTNLAIADNFCANETKFKLLSTSLLSAFSDKGRGNTSDANYCGGTSALTENGSEFNITLTDYCVQFREQQVLLNGTIDGIIESGANFVSASADPDISITGEGVDLSIVGHTWDGRNDDMFLTLTITDNLSGHQIELGDTNIKKGEFDFGHFSFGAVGPYDFKFINHFNAELTEGQLFIYGSGEELLILTAENGIVTVVFKTDRHDPGVLVESNCSS